MNLFDLTLLIPFVIVHIILILLFVFFVKNQIQRLYFACIIISISVYSGIGNTFTSLNSAYLNKYYFFIFIFTVSLILFNRLLYKSKHLGMYCKKIEKIDFKKSTYIILLILFFLVYFVRMIIPDFRLLELILPPKSSIVGIFAKMDKFRGHWLLEVTRLINIMLFPFFLQIVSKLFMKRKKFLSIFLLLLWFYLRYVNLGYISRYEIVIFLMFVFFFFIMNFGEKNKVSLYWLSIGLILFLLSLPLLNQYIYTRAGIEVEDASFIQSSLKLIETEGYYPSNYAFSETIYSSDLKYDFYKWVVLLPLPTPISGGLKNNPLIINNFFTTSLTGLSSGDIGFSILLPSIFGEALILYGSYYVFHAIFLAAYISIISTVLIKNKNTRIIAIYFAFQSLTIGRGGISGFIGGSLNSLFYYFVFLTIFAYTINTKRKNTL